MDKLNEKLALYRVEYARGSGKCSEMAEQIINLMQEPGKVLLVRFRGGSLSAKSAELRDDIIKFDGTPIPIRDILAVSRYDGR